MAIFAGLSFLATLVLPGCTPYDLALTSGAAISEAMMEERGIATSTRDYSLRLAVNDAFFQRSVKLFRKVSLMVNRGDVVLVGRVDDALSRLEAEILAREAGAQIVHNAITVGAPLSWPTVVQDHMIENQFALSLLADGDVASVNFQHSVKDGVLYIAGDARTPSELRRVAYLGSHLPNVKQVVTYVYVLPPPLDTVNKPDKIESR